jgi:hypothetical protein
LNPGAEALMRQQSDKTTKLTNEKQIFTPGTINRPEQITRVDQKLDSLRPLIVSPGAPGA